VVVSRSRKRARARGYAFVQFADALVARIAAESLNGYPLGGKVVRSEVVDPAKVHPALFANADRPWAAVPWRTVIREKQAAPKSARQAEGKMERLFAQEAAQAERLKAQGIDYALPTTYHSLAVKQGLLLDAESRAPLAGARVSSPARRKQKIRLGRRGRFGNKFAPPAGGGGL
jgi:nucleolar protein 15